MQSFFFFFPNYGVINPHKIYINDNIKNFAGFTMLTTVEMR